MLFCGNKESNRSSVSVWLDPKGLHKRNGAKSIQRLCAVVCPTLLKWCGWTAAAHSQPLRNVMVSSLWLCLYFLRNTGFRGAKQQEALRTFHVFQCSITTALSQETCILPSQAQKECAEKLATQLEEVWNKTKSHMKSTMAACDTCQFLWCGTALMMRQVLSDNDRRLLRCALTEALWEVSLAMARFAQTVEECSIGMMIQTHQKGSKRPRRNWLLHARLNTKKRKPMPCPEEQGPKPLCLDSSNNISKGNYFYLFLGSCSSRRANTCELAGTGLIKKATIGGSV